MSTILQTDGRSVRATNRRNARRERILEVAQQVISTRGYQSTSIADVIKAAEISRGTFYLYFDSREALFHELLDRFIQELIDCIKVVRIEDGSPVEQLNANLLRVVDLLIRNRHLTVILLREAVGIDEKVDKKLNALNRFLHRMISGALRNGAKWGLTRKVNETVVAMAIIGCIREVLYQYLVVNRESNPDPQTIAQELLSFGLVGLKHNGIGSS